MGASLKTTKEVSASTLKRVVIENVTPAVDFGRFPAKRVVGEFVSVEADIFVDGHQLLGAAVLFRRASETAWSQTPMTLLSNDHWSASFEIATLEDYVFTVRAWIDHFSTQIKAIDKKVEAGQDVQLDLFSLAELAAAASRRAPAGDRRQLMLLASELETSASSGRDAALSLARSERFAALMERNQDPSQTVDYEKELEVKVERPQAVFSSWYEMFPRSCTNDPAKPGTFRDCIARLPYIVEMGFDVLYFPPIHPIGRDHRKGKDNSTTLQPGDPGSPWAIGSVEGGHKAIHPALGTLTDFQALQAAARKCQIEIALDLAFQCAPDHPYVKDHPQWFLRRSDGSIQYAENPPKRYEDIYPFHFESADGEKLAHELLSVVLFWIDQGVRIFRVDNPHTKPFAFWESLIQNVHLRFPDVIFLSEAFTRPRIAYRLAKLGFSQSYTYFAWKNTKSELTQLLTELTTDPVREFFRMNLWPNTPDILTEQFQDGRPVFVSRVILAATLAASYGIYGPAYELCENRRLQPGSEEYLNSEKYQIRAWDLANTDSLKPLIARLNEIRKNNPALQSDRTLEFHEIDNDQLIAYSKITADASNAILTIVNLDPHSRQSGWLELPLDRFQLGPNEAFQAHDLLTDTQFTWQGARNYVELHPASVPAHILRISRRVAG
jgi:starch synthase (maltosyl-transferring)